MGTMGFSKNLGKGSASRRALHFVLSDAYNKCHRNSTPYIRLCKMTLENGFITSKTDDPRRATLLHCRMY